MKPRVTRGTFHYEKSLSRKKQRLSFKRRIGSFMAIGFGGFVCYTALHYVPAFLNTSKLLAISKIDVSAQRLSASADQSPMTHFLKTFKMKRAYLRGGQSIMAQYALPENSKLELEIVQCRRSLFFEVFKCIPDGEQNIVITNKTVGSQKFAIGQAGFYEFRNSVKQSGNASQAYQILWRRS